MTPRQTWKLRFDLRMDYDGWLGSAHFWSMSSSVSWVLHQPSFFLAFVLVLHRQWAAVSTYLQLTVSQHSSSIWCCLWLMRVPPQLSTLFRPGPFMIRMRALQGRCLEYHGFWGLSDEYRPLCYSAHQPHPTVLSIFTCYYSSPSLRPEYGQLGT